MVSQLIVRFEQNEPTRQRKRRAVDAERFQNAVECVICNLIAVSLVVRDRPLAIPLANAASKAVPIFGKSSRAVIDQMLSLGLVTKVKGYPLRGPTTIQATRKLRTMLAFGKRTWGCLRLQDYVEVVVLKKRADAELEDSNLTEPHVFSPVDTQWLARIRAEMHTINAAILAAPIEYAGTAQAHVSERPGAAMASIVTHHHRAMWRVFNGSFAEGGRAFGSVWQTMPKADRFKHIRIDGEPIAVVDYGQLFLRLAYAEIAAQPPSGDLYDLTGEDGSRPGWKQLRVARKKLVNALFFRNAPLKQWPGASLLELAEVRDAFPPGTKPRDAIAGIKAKHARIAHLFETGCGLRFMRTESDLIVAVTLALFERKIVALPIHDAVVVAKPKAFAAKEVMEAEAKRMTGAMVPASIQA